MEIVLAIALTSVVMYLLITAMELSNRIAGMLCVVKEDTEQVIAARVGPLGDQP